MKTLTGSCHCGAVAFETRFEGQVETSKCNCSICTKSRFWKTLVPSEAFTLLKGEDALCTYRFGSEIIAHRICGICGVKVFGTVKTDDMDLVAVSVPCLDLGPEALAALPVAFEDGRHDEHARTPGITSYL
jgi:hypothetical protein